MEPLAALPAAPVPAGPSPLPDQLPADAILPALPASDASDDVHPDAAADAIVPVQAVAQCVEKLVVPEPVGPELVARERPAQLLLQPAAEPCTPDVAPSAA
jgi:hypothetical protein